MFELWLGDVLLKTCETGEEALEWREMLGLPRMKVGIIQDLNDIQILEVLEDE